MKKSKPLGVFSLLWTIIRGRTSFFLKCDAKGCAYQAHYPYPHWDLVDTPCPLCGENLCTKKDMEEFIKAEIK